MAKETTQSTPVDTPVSATSATADAFPLTLTEFCTRLSVSDRRVELIGGFEHSERVLGRVSDLEVNFAKRFAEFANQPA
jgi:hypothetical protein